MSRYLKFVIVVFCFGSCYGAMRFDTCNFSAYNPTKTKVEEFSPNKTKIVSMQTVNKFDYRGSHSMEAGLKKTQTVKEGASLSKSSKKKKNPRWK